MQARARSSGLKELRLGALNKGAGQRIVSLARAF
jgi:hypothetical protein